MTLGGRRFLLSLAIVAASVCLALGVSLPIIKLTKFVFFTYEHSLHFVTRRLWSWRAEFGAESHWSVALGRQVAAQGADALWPRMAGA